MHLREKLILLLLIISKNQTRETEMRCKDTESSFRKDIIW